jgi:hypothetical protein
MDFSGGSVPYIPNVQARKAIARVAGVWPHSFRAMTITDLFSQRVPLTMASHTASFNNEILALILTEVLLSK